MVLFQFQLEGEHLNHNQWAYDEGYIEGDMQIYVNDEVFFETVVNVVELGIQIGRWAEAIRHGYMIDFAYDTINHDEPVLNFTVQKDGVQLYSIWQQFDMQELVPLEMLTNAVTSYLYALNLNLHEMKYFEQLDRFLDHNYSENAKALMFLEQNEYDAAFTLLKKRAEEQRDVQSLNNLAWMYIQEEDDLTSAKALLEEVLQFNPKSYFPYNMLGEIALAEENLTLAETYLTQSLQIELSEEATHNLGIVYFHQGRFMEAANCFASVSKGFDLSKLYKIFTLIKCGQKQKAKEILACWRPEDGDDVRATEIADFYLEMGEYPLAKKWFAFDWSDGYNPLYDATRYAYTLIQLGEEALCQQIIDQVLALKTQQINEVIEEACDEDWTEHDKQEWVAELQAEKVMLQQLVEQIKQGYVPPFEFDLYATSSCYLFGCQRHGHTEYSDKNE